MKPDMNTLDVETKIIEAARNIFLKKGYNETSMEEIAAAVGLTRPALNYYFRKKERLFQAVLGSIVMTFLPKIKDIIVSEISLEEKVSHIVNVYFDIFSGNPDLPMFIMKEAQRDFANLVHNAADNQIAALGNSVFKALDEEMEAGRIRRVPMIEVFSTFYGLMTFPFVARPIASRIFGEESFNMEMRERWSTHITEQMLSMLRP